MLGLCQERGCSYRVTPNLLFTWPPWVPESSRCRSWKILGAIRVPSGVLWARMPFVFGGQHRASFLDSVLLAYTCHGPTVHAAVVAIK